MKSKIEIYRETDVFGPAKDAWRWRYVASNGRILADGGEAYREKTDALRGALAVTRLALPKRSKTPYGGRGKMEPRYTLPGGGQAKVYVYWHRASVVYASWLLPDGDFIELVIA